MFSQKFNSYYNKMYIFHVYISIYLALIATAWFDFTRFNHELEIDPKNEFCHSTFKYNQSQWKSIMDNSSWHRKQIRIDKRVSWETLISLFVYFWFVLLDAVFSLSSSESPFSPELRSTFINDHTPVPRKESIWPNA